MNRSREIIDTIRTTYGVAEGAIPLHAPVFNGREKQYVDDTIDSTFVSSVGAYVDRFERQLVEATGAGYAVATVNGTTALQMALLLAGVERDDLVITQALSFVGTANAIKHAGADPVFIDVERSTLGLSPDALEEFLETACERTPIGVRHKESGRRVAAVVPMHSFGLPVRIAEIQNVCDQWNIPLVEDAAEALGSRYNNRACGTFGRVAALSFNGNKIVTTGGGGAVLTDDEALAKRAKHLTTTAKTPHPWLFQHDEVGYNFRLPNLNAALGCAQLERLPKFLSFKRDLARRYEEAFGDLGIEFVHEPSGTASNYWLCALLVSGREERDQVLAESAKAGVMTRPVWEPLNSLPPYRTAFSGPLPVTESLADRLISIPSGFRELGESASRADVGD